MQLSEVFCLTADLGLLLGVSKLNERTDAWICEVDKHWTLALNGTDKDVEVNIKDSMGVDKLHPFHMAVFFNGWLAGLMTATGGVICAGEAGNEDNLIKALQNRIAVETLAQEMTAT